MTSCYFLTLACVGEGSFCPYIWPLPDRENVVEHSTEHLLNLVQLCQGPLLRARWLLIEDISAGDGVWGHLLEVFHCKSPVAALSELSDHW